MDKLLNFIYNRLNKQFVLRAIQKTRWALKHADDSLKKDKDIVLAAVQENGLASEYVGQSLKKNKIDYFDRKLDTSGMSSPLPEVLTNRVLRTMARKKVLKVICTDSGMYTDIPALVKQTGNLLLERIMKGDKYIFHIQKGRAYRSPKTRRVTSK